MKAAKRLLLLISFTGLVGTGCQTFTLTKHDFERQQLGQPTDPETAVLVGDAVTAAYLGAAIGGALAGGK